jgi:8-oxo-dGTP diphosphatase
VILRKTDKGNLKVLVAHRPQYDDWSFPKGKADKGESSAETAVREILEETGLRCRIVAPLTTTRYRVGSGMKEVEWFVMRPLPDSPGFKKNNEVDKIKWMGRKAARKLLDYDHDRGLITDFDLKKVAETGTIHLLRHATAGNRDNFNGDDRERPLTKKGKAQAKSIAESLREREIERIVTSPYKRCVQTVEPLAKMIGATIEISDALAEGPDIDAAYDLIHNLAGANAVLCSHGDVIPAAMNRLMWLGLTIHSRFYCSKGSIWEVDIEGGRYTEGRYVPPPVI